MCVVRKREKTLEPRQHFSFKMFSWHVVPVSVVVMNYKHNSEVMQETVVKFSSGYFSVDLLQ